MSSLEADRVGAGRPPGMKRAMFLTSGAGTTLDPPPPPQQHTCCLAVKLGGLQVVRVCSPGCVYVNVLGGPTARKTSLRLIKVNRRNGDEWISW